MTVSKTPRLGLILPAGSDNFDPADFDDTFTRLDNRPGILPVANYAALPSGLTSANHGSTYLTLDTQSLWMWNRPGAGAGAWVKINSVGFIDNDVQGATVSTSTTDTATAPTLCSINIAVPGGRNMLAMFTHNNVTNNGTFGYSRVDMWQDGSIIESDFQSGGAPGKRISHLLFQRLVPVSPGGTINIKVTVASTSYGGGTTSANGGGGHLVLWEI